MTTVTKEDVEQYLDELAWSSDATAYEVYTVIDNINRFYIWLTIKNNKCTTVSDVIDEPDKTVVAPDYDMVLGG